MMKKRGRRTAQQAGEGSMSGGTFPEHTEKKSCEERSIYEGENELQRIVDIVEAGDRVGSANR